MYINPEFDDAIPLDERPVPIRTRRAARVLSRSTIAVVSILFGIALVIIGIAMVYLPAAVIATGLTIVGAVTFDPAAVRKLTWPR